MTGGLERFQIVSVRLFLLSSGSNGPQWLLNEGVGDNQRPIRNEAGSQALKPWNLDRLRITILFALLQPGPMIKKSLSEGFCDIYSRSRTKRDVTWNPHQVADSADMNIVPTQRCALKKSAWSAVTGNGSRWTSISSRLITRRGSDL